MSDLISRQAATDGLDSHYVERINLNDWQAGWNNALEWVQGTYLDDLPPAEPQRKTEKALRLLVEWAIECGFGYDNIPEEYEKYKDDIADMGYIDGLIYIAKMEAEHE